MPQLIIEAPSTTEEIVLIALRHDSDGVTVTAQREGDDEFIFSLLTIVPNGGVTFHEGVECNSGFDLPEKKLFLAED